MLGTKDEGLDTCCSIIYVSCDLSPACYVAIDCMYNDQRTRGAACRHIAHHSLILGLYIVAHTR